MEEVINKSLFLPFIDSICTVMEYESFVKEIMIQELSDSIGYVPFIKIERWGEYTNEQDN